MKTVSIVQYVRPDGRKRMVHKDFEEEFADKVERIQENGFEISMEVLSTGQVAMYVSNDEEDLMTRVSKNGPEVDEKFRQMVEMFVKGMPVDSSEGYLDASKGH